MIENLLDTATVEWLHKVLSNPKDYSKLTTKRLEEISRILFTPETHKYIFPNHDTCHCSSAQRKLYRERFELSLNLLRLDHL